MKIFLITGMTYVWLFKSLVILSAAERYEQK